VSIQASWVGNGSDSEGVVDPLQIFIGRNISSGEKDSISFSGSAHSLEPELFLSKGNPIDLRPPCLFGVFILLLFSIGVALGGKLSKGKGTNRLA